MKKASVYIPVKRMLINASLVFSHKYLSEDLINSMNFDPKFHSTTLNKIFQYNISHKLRDEMRENENN